MENSEINGSGTAQSAQPIKKKPGRKPSMAKVMKKTEIIPNFSAPTQSSLTMKYASKPSTVVNAMGSSEIIGSDTGPTQSVQLIKKCAIKSEIMDCGTVPTPSAQPIEKFAVKPEIMDSSTVPTQSAQPIETFGVKPEIMDSSTVPTQSDQSFKEKSTEKPSTVVSAVENPEAIDSITAPNQCGQHTKKKSARKPSKVVRRRIPLKKDHFKAPRPVFIPVASETLAYKDTVFTRGDIVSVVNSDDRVYYAQIRGLLQNQYCEKSAVLTWLLPTTESPKGKFDPMTYILGHEEDIPRDLEYLEFVCHAPSEYFKCSNPSYPEFPQKPVLGFAQTRKGYVIVKLPCEEFTTDSE